MTCSIKTRSSKIKIFILKFIPITHSIIYHCQKAKRNFFCSAKVIEGPQAPECFIDRVVFRFHSDSVLFRFLIDRILFRVLSDRVFFESAVIGSSSRSAVIDSSLGSSVLFFRHAAIFFIKTCY